MVRAGGEADKLGNQYESFWTVDCFLEVVVGKKKSITVEAFGPDSQGVEFHLVTPENSRVFYSAKRQNQRALGWSVNDLCKPDHKTSRSILGDLFQKVIAKDADRVVFVSATGANHLREIIERAGKSASFDDLWEALSKTLRDELRLRILPLVNDDTAVALACLKASETKTRGHVDQKEITERRIEMLLYRTDGEPNDNADIRLSIAEFVLENLGASISTDEARSFINSKGISLRDWKSDPVIQDSVSKVNRRFLGVVESELINHAHIIRNQTNSVVALLDDVKSRGALIVAPGGWGKSCVVAQVAKALESKSVPFLALKLDSLKSCETTRQLGTQLDLPASPVTVLAGISDGSVSVIIVDQLDAISLVSGRNPSMWEVFRQLQEEVSDHPKMKLVLACRDFDLDHDHRLQRYGDQKSGFQKVLVRKLTREEIEKTISLANVGSQFELTTTQADILGVPFHLLLFLLGDPEKNFSTVAELYERYWRRKQENLRTNLGRDAHWNEVVDGLTNHMSETQSLIAPKVVVSDWERDAECMASENVLIPFDDDCYYRFFHESFFDYAYARRFCSSGRSVVDFLLSDEQHLFRRSQVRQVLSYRRRNDPTNYLRDIKAVFDSPKVRFHIKRVVSSQLRQVENPNKDEWDLLKEYFFDGELSPFVSNAMRDHEGWFDLLNELGVLAEWLVSNKERLVNTAIWLLGQHGIHDTRSGAIAELIFPYCDKGADWQEKIQNVLRWGNAHKSEKMKEIFLKLLRDGAYDNFESKVAGDDFWGCMHKVEDESPKFLVDVVATWFARTLVIYDDGKSWSVLGKCSQNGSHTGALMVMKAAETEPLYFVERLLPLAIDGIRETEHINGSRLPANRIWPSLSSHGSPFRVDDALLLGLKNALQHLAKHDSESYRVLVKPLVEMQHETVAFLLLRSWAANPVEFSNECVDYLIEDPRRLHIGYLSWSGGSDATGHCAVSRLAIRAVSPECSEDKFKKLEKAIVSYQNEYEKSDPRNRGFYQLHVIRSLETKRVSQETKLKREELERKFPNVSDVIVTGDEGALVKAVGSPISPDICELMNDGQWISAMAKYTAKPGRSFKGGPVELSRLLRVFANKDRVRFAAMVGLMPENIEPVYFSAILNGMCGLYANKNNDEKQADQKVFEGFPTEGFVKVIRKLHSLPEQPCGNAIVNCIEKLSSRVLPDELIAIAMHYAMNSPDPEKDLWKKEEGNYYGGDPFSYGINCTRGQAAEAVAALIWDDNSRLVMLRPALESFANDSVIAVRTCGLNSFLALLNFEKEEAVDLFLKACENCADICGTPPFDRFLRYTVESHYEKLRPCIQFALDCGLQKAVENAARQVILGELHGVNVGSDAKGIRSGSETMRQTAANVYAHNLDSEEVGDICAGYLREFFNDESEKVRSEVSVSFLRLNGKQLLGLEPFIADFVESKCFECDPDCLLRSLVKSNVKLPAIICRAAERVLELVGAEGGSIANKGARSAFNISKLVIRQYEQSSDSKTKSHCLDLIDQMEKVGYLGIGDELSKLDRL